MPSSIIIYSILWLSLSVIVSDTSPSSSTALESVIVKSINRSMFCFASFIISLETSIISSVSLSSKRSSSIQMSSVLIFLEGFVSSTMSSIDFQFFVQKKPFHWCYSCFLCLLFPYFLCLLTHISPVSHICDMYVYALFKHYFSVKLAGFCFLIVKHMVNIHQNSNFLHKPILGPKIPQIWAKFLYLL